MVPLYMDENVREAVTRALRERDVDVLTVQEDGRARAPDPEVLDRATELGRVLFSQDRDLLVEAARRQDAGESFSGVVYAHQQRVSIRDCIEQLELIGLAGEPHDFADRVQFLPL
jgi:predicted nuclease of predicted toxin-antitoxin system